MGQPLKYIIDQTIKNIIFNVRALDLLNSWKELSKIDSTEALENSYSVEGQIQCMHTHTCMYHGIVSLGVHE